MKPASIVLKQIIKHGDIPICKNCIYFKPHPSQLQLGKCIKFGEKNLVSGKITFSYASLNRVDQDLCGPNGLYFTQNQLKPEI